ncbi:unnamed protein product, partial [Pleuronectes platessa]
ATGDYVLLCVCVAAALPGTTLPNANSPSMGEERRRTAFRSASTSRACRGLEDDGVTLMSPLSLVILARCLAVTSRPDRSVKKEEEMFLYLECGHFILGYTAGATLASPLC